MSYIEAFLKILRVNFLHIQILKFLCIKLNFYVS
jgi:hypothetical protein